MGAAMSISTGIHTISAAEYHADPAEKPSLSSSIAGIIWHRTPLHGWMAHPRLNPDLVRHESSTFDLGSAAHALILENDESKLVIVDADDWRTKAAREARDAARAEGKIPLLKNKYEEVANMVEAAHHAIAVSELQGLFDDGKPEQTVIAKDGDTWLRGRFDWFTNDRKIILDYKTVGRSAAPESFLRSSVFQFGYDIQAAMYTRLLTLLGCEEDTKFVWLVQETEAPYACSLIGASPSMIEAGTRKLDYVKRQWDECLATGNWPGYGKRIAWLEAPAWELGKVEEREFIEMENEE